MDAGPRPTNAEMAQLVAMLEDRGLVEVYVNDEGQEVYRLTAVACGSATCSRWWRARMRTTSWMRC